uniref:Prolyl endopeptidase n=1 Tax=Meloidogyne javanica TaxID=6303 RepID=A0A915LMN1_MELJA
MSSSSIDINPKCYPLVERGNVVDDYHGKKIPDPYRALEEPDAEITKDFVQKINSISEPFFQACSCRGVFRERLTSTWDYEKFGCPSIHGDYYYYFYNSGLQNHYVLYQQKSLDEKGKVFMNPNTWSEDGTTSLSHTSWTEDGTLLAYGVSEKGSDWKTIKFKKCSGEELADVIPGVKFSGLSWLHDNSGVLVTLVYFFRISWWFLFPGLKAVRYLHTEELGILTGSRRGKTIAGLVPCLCKYPEVKTTTEGSSTEKHEYHSLYFHRLGTDSKDDVLVYERRDYPGYFIGAGVSDDGKFLFVSLDKGCDPKNQLYYFDLTTQTKIDGKLELIPLFDKSDATYSEIDSDDNSALIMTNFNAPMFKIVRVKIGQGATANQNDNWEEIIAEDPRRKLDWAMVVDGNKLLVCYMEDVKIPMFVLYNKSLNLDGNNGAILYGYGGYNIARQPDFSVSRLLFLKHFGGVYAIANIRGGGEYGEKWHEEGMRDKKQNVFDDFICAAEELIKLKYTKPEKLAIHGHSNGGLLTAVCAQQRPDLFGAVVVGVGVLDMLRFHKFTIGGAWISEFGSPDVAEDFDFIYKYSPLHQISVQPNVQWPAMLITSADHDDRVVPLHTLKYLAQLYYTLHNEAYNWQTKPVLGRIEVKAGHGAGKPTTKIIDELVDMYSFLQRVLDLKWID